MAERNDFREHFEAVYEKYSNMLYRLALTHTASEYDAQDVVQDVFIKYYNKGAFKDDEHERAWLIRVTINACRDLLRKNKYRTHEQLEDYTHLEMEQEEELPEVIHLVEKLPQKLRSVVVLHYLEGYSVEEIARMLHVGNSAVKMRLKRAREAMAKQKNMEE